jgi:hypothetical protein
MAKKSALVLCIFIAIIVSFSGCRSYGYRPNFGGGPHIDGTPEWSFPLYIQHRPVPMEELKTVYPPESNISTK